MTTRGAAMLRDLANRSMIVTLCAAALCAGACKKTDNAAGSGSAASGVSQGAIAASGGGGDGGDRIVIGVLSDMSGPYADFAGKGSELAAQMAVADFGGKVAGLPIEVISADHQNKPDIGSSIAREWYDTKGVDVIVDVPSSSVALAVSEVTKSKNKVFL